jgi:hypothetical protein
MFKYLLLLLFSLSFAQDRLLVQIKIGDQDIPGSEQLGMKDGYIIDYIDEREWGRRVDVSDWTKKCFALIEVDRSMKDSIKSWLHDNGEDPNSQKYRSRKEKFDLKKLAKTLGDSSLNEKWRSTQIVPVKSAKGKDIKKDIETSDKIDLDNAIFDLNSIASGTYTIGSGGDYLTISAWTADFAGSGFTGNMNGQIISNITEASISNFLVNYNGYTLNLTGDTEPSGDATSGRLVSFNFATRCFLITTGAAGTTNIYGFRTKLLVASGFESIVVSSTSPHVVNIFNMYMDGDGNGFSALWKDQNCELNYYNNVIWDYNSYGVTVGGSAFKGYNCAVYGCGTAGAFSNAGGSSAIWRSVILFDNGTDASLNAGNVIENCASSDASIPAGSGNKRSLTSTVQVNVTDTETDFMHPLSGVVDVATGGNTNHLSLNDAAGNSWDIDPSIGFIQFQTPAPSDTSTGVKKYNIRRRVGIGASTWK